MTFLRMLPWISISFALAGCGNENASTSSVANGNAGTSGSSGGGAGSGGIGGSQGGSDACGPKPSTGCAVMCGPPVDLICVSGNWMCPVGGEPCAGAGGASAGGAAGAGAAAGAAGAGGAPEYCGGEAGIPCPAGYFCDFIKNTCGGGDQLGLCLPKVDPGCSTSATLPAVCGCDGKVYKNICEAMVDGVDVAEQNLCTAPANTFRCGHLFCKADQYCNRYTSQVPSLPDSYACMPLPDACLTIDALPSCQCMKNATGIPCIEGCQDDGKGAVTLNCPGG